MGFTSLIKERFSSRDYQSTPVERQKLDIVLEAARIAPTAANRQPIKIYVFQKGEMRDKINSTYAKEWIKPAPIVLMITALNQNAWHHPKTGKSAGTTDASIVTDHMTLAATAVGLSTCWICNFDVEACTRYFNLSENEEPIALLPLGYSNVKANLNRHATDRKPLDDLIRYL